MFIIRQRELNILVNALFFTRVGRFCVGGVLLLVALSTGIYALDGASFHEKTGTLVAATEYRDAQTNDYKYTTFRLAGDSTTYTFITPDFTPALPDRFAQVQVRLWYIDAPFHSQQIVAMNLSDPQSKASVHYATQAYTDPGAVRNRNLIIPAILLLSGLVFIVLAVRMRRAPQLIAPIAADQEHVEQRYAEPVLR